MKVTYNGPIDEVVVDATGDVVRAGQSIEVPNDIGDQLIEQGWSGRHSAGWKSEPKDVVPPADEDTNPAAAGDTEGS
jgi:hypothetical protein